MTSPHADEILALADGRVLAWAEWGDSRGSPLVFFHPCPGSRMLCPDPVATAAAGVRLITVDRPGYGRSDRVAEPTLTGFAEDLERLLDHLWLGQVQVVGWCYGGLYAAACAAVLSERVSAVALVATPAPEIPLPWLPPSLRKVARLAKNDPGRALAVGEALGAALAGAPGRSGEPWIGPAELVDPEAMRALETMWAEAFCAGAAGLAADVVAGSRPWAFAPSHVRAPAALFYAEDDPVVEPAHAQWWARAIPRAEIILRPGGGHLFPFVAWGDILKAVT